LQASGCVHFSAQLPPQSTSVSLPFFRPSKQVGVAHVPAGHAPVVHSIDSSQCLPKPQGGQLPPQSTSVSIPFWTRSAHVGSRQVPSEHDAVAQSAFTAHFRP